MRLALRFLPAAAALVLAPALALAQVLQAPIAVPDGPAPGPRPAALDPCLQCDVLYAGDCGQGLWSIDLTTMTSTFIGTMPANMFDLAVTSDGRLVGIAGGGPLFEVSACDGTGVGVGQNAAGNGLAGDGMTPDLFAQGPPLVRVDGTWVLAPVDVGGTIGGAPPAWCGSSTGDLAMDPDDRLLRSTISCASCPGSDRLVVVDPASGGVVSEAGCVRDALGTGYSGVFGLAYDSAGNLWGVRGVVDPSILRIDPATARATRVPVSGGLDCAFGLASVPCAFLRPCSPPGPIPADVGPVLRVRRGGNRWDPLVVVADLQWQLDRGRPRPPGQHYHVRRGTDPRLLWRIAGTEPWLPTSYSDSTPRAGMLPFVHYYEVVAADACEQESRD